MDRSPREECEELMRSLLPLAKQMLVQYGEFYPYGGTMKPSGEIVHAGAKLEGTDHPESAPLIELLRATFANEALQDECKATAVIYDVRIKLPGSRLISDAIQVCLDHRDNYSVDVLFPYSILEPGKVVYGEAFAQKGQDAVFLRE